jgi:cysteine synthase A
MLADAEAMGRLAPGAHVVEATSGNTGVALAMLAAARGYRFTAVLPESDRGPRTEAMEAYGAEVVTTPEGAEWESAEGPLGVAERMASERGALFLNQFRNPANPEAHALGTALEILDDLGGDLDVVVAGVGSGGTVTGLARTLKPSVPGLEVVAVAASGSYLGSDNGNGRVPGITPDFEPAVFRKDLVDEVVLVAPEAARARARELAATEGLWVGPSSGAVVEAAVAAARRHAAGVVVAVLADTGRNTAVTS